MLSVTIGFWLQKKYLNRGVEDPKPVKPKDTDGKSPLPSDDRNNFITENKNKSFQGIPFVICMSMFFMAFYMTAIYLSFRAYREFKGTMEDNLGGPEAMAEYHEKVNMIGYGTIDSNKG